MNKLLELSNIALLPADKNNGYVEKKNFGVLDSTDNTLSLPIFTAPLNSVVDETNHQVWSNNGIRPVLPRTTDLQIRLDGCQYIFSSFSLKEVKDCFLSRKRESQKQFRVCIETGNGQDVEIFNVGSSLKKLYGNQIILMGSNLANPKAYVDYCKSGFDFVRVGLNNGGMVNNEKYGFYYPMASLIMDTYGTRSTSTIGLHQPKIIADGGIDSPASILKAIAVGADYVMLGRELVRLVEAAGPLYIFEAEGSKTVKKPIKPETAAKLEPAELRETNLKRKYQGLTSDEIRQKIITDTSDWCGISKFYNPSDANIDNVNVTKTIEMWQGELLDCFNYGFTLAGATDWESFKKNIKYTRID